LFKTFCLFQALLNSKGTNYAKCPYSAHTPSPMNCSRVCSVYSKNYVDPRFFARNSAYGQIAHRPNFARKRGEKSAASAKDLKNPRRRIVLVNDLLQIGFSTAMPSSSISASSFDLNNYTFSSLVFTANRTSSEQKEIFSSSTGRERRELSSFIDIFSPSSTPSPTCRQNRRNEKLQHLICKTTRILNVVQALIAQAQSAS